MNPRAYHFDATLTEVVALMNRDPKAAEPFKAALLADLKRATANGDPVRIPALREAIADTTPLETAPYGHCPFCKAPANRREPRENGNDHCPNGHVYPSPETGQIVPPGFQRPEFQRMQTSARP